MKTAEEMNQLRELRDKKRSEMLEWQKQNTHKLEHGYIAMPTIQSGGVGWELHPPQGSGGVRGAAPVFTGPVWYVKDLEEARRKVEKHRRFYTGDGVFMPVA
jgi:hypothetical protein